MNILNYYSHYYDNFILNVIPEIFKDLLTYGGKYQGNEHVLAYITDEFNYFLKFFNQRLSEFISNVFYADNKTAFTFTSDFSEKEREAALNFLELNAYIKGDQKYLTIKDTLSEYKKDLNHEERIEHIGEMLEKFLRDEIGVDSFMLIAEEVKETFYEIDYIIEKLTENEILHIEHFIFKLFLSLDSQRKEIILACLKAMNKINYNQKLEFCIEKLDDEKGKTVDYSIYGSILKSFEE